MKLFRHGAAGKECPGAVDSEGALRDLSPLVPDLTPEWLSPPRLEALRAIDLRRMPLVPDGVRLGAPVTGTRQFVCIGANYRKHVEEAGIEVPKEPIVFFKALGSLAGPNDDVKLAPGSVSTDWEVELGIVIGSLARQVSQADALRYVAGYCLANDVSDRDWQLNRSGGQNQWAKGKSFDGFGPIGPWLLTADELPDPQTIPLRLSVNAQLRQNSNTSDQIFGVAKVVSYLSQMMTLLPGDVVITGTPGGVGLGMKPPVYLRDGDVMELDGGPLGRQRQRVIASAAR